MLLANFAWPQLKDMPMSDLVVIVPLGSFEQHGPHLPLTTDTDIMTAIAEKIERSLQEKVLLLPCLWIGHSTHHMHFPGTLDITQTHYIAVIQDLCRSILSMGAVRILLLNGHGGSDIPVRTALREVKTELAGGQRVHALVARH